MYMTEAPRVLHFSAFIIIVQSSVPFHVYTTWLVFLQITLSIVIWAASKELLMHTPAEAHLAHADVRMFAMIVLGPSMAAMSISH